MTLEDTGIPSNHAKDDWDFENAEMRPAVKGRSVVVSVRLDKDDFNKISERAEDAGVPTSTFIRAVVLENVNGSPGATIAYWNSGTAGHFTTTATFGHTTKADQQAMLIG